MKLDKVSIRHIKKLIMKIERTNIIKKLEIISKNWNQKPTITSLGKKALKNEQVIRYAVQVHIMPISDIWHNEMRFCEE